MTVDEISKILLKKSAHHFKDNNIIGLVTNVVWYLRYFDHVRCIVNSSWHQVWSLTEIRNQNYIELVLATKLRRVVKSNITVRFGRDFMAFTEAAF